MHGPTLTRSTSVFGPNSALKSLPMNCMFFLLGEVHAHQHFSLVVVCNQCYNGTFADVFCQQDLSPSLVQWDSNSMFVLEFSSFHENVLLVCLPNLGFAWSPCLVYEYCIPPVSFSFSDHFFDSISAVQRLRILLQVVKSNTFSLCFLNRFVFFLSAAVARAFAFSCCARSCLTLGSNGLPSQLNSFRLDVWYLW